MAGQGRFAGSRGPLEEEADMGFGEVIIYGCTVCVFFFV